MKPGDHPDFFRFPAPKGRSRESTIVLSRDGRFFHDGEPIRKKAMERAFFRWLRRHPESGRFILSNGYDWTYLTVEGCPYFVTACRLDIEAKALLLTLSDQSEEPLDPSTLVADVEGHLSCRVKGGSEDALLLREASLALMPYLEESGEGQVTLRVFDQVTPVGGARQGPLPRSLP